MKKLSLRLNNGFMTHVGKWPLLGQDGTSRKTNHLVVFQPDGVRLGINQAELAVDSATAHSAFRKAYGKAREMERNGERPCLFSIDLDEEVEGGRLMVNIPSWMEGMSQDLEAIYRLQFNRTLTVREDGKEQWDKKPIAGPLHKLP